MKTQGWAWLAAGVLALSLNSVYQEGGAAWAHRIADRIVSRSAAALALASGRAESLLANASLVTTRHETQSCRLATAFARMNALLDRTTLRAHTGFDRFELISAQQEAHLARLEAGRARIEAQTARIRFAVDEFNAPDIKVICPRVRVRVPRVPVVRGLHIETPGMGPV
jgi:hypothetical protein